MVTEPTDLLIIGGGPAGAAAGIALVDAGYPVTIIEKQESVKDKICGEFYSPDCLSYLHEMDGRQDFLLHNPSTICNVTVSIDGASVHTTFNTPAYGLSRVKFDSMMLEKAEKKGVSVLRGFEVTDVIFGNGDITLNARRRKTGEHRSYRTKYAIGATGAKSGSESLLVKNGKDRSKNSGAIAFKFHAECPGIKDAIELYFTQYGYIGIANIENGVVNVCGLIDGDVIKSREGNIDSLLEEISNKDPVLRKRLESMKRKSSIITCSNLSFEVRGSKFKEMFCIGDAAGSIHPFCGDGNAMAIKSGLLVADVISDGIKNNRGRQRTVELFKRTWSNEFKSRIRFSSLVHRLLARNTTRTVSAFLTKIFPHVIHAVYSSTRETKL